MRKLYTQLSNLLNAINFNELWEGFHFYDFALYNDREVYLKDSVIPYDNRFMGNTAINYEGQYIAIWNVENPDLEDIEVLAANLVHEMFHAYQYEMKESRWPQDLRTLDYPSNIENFKFKYAENKILAAAYLEKNIEKKKRLISQFASIRNMREKNIVDIIRCEYLSETAEGMAEYVGIMALKQISINKYNTRMKKYIGYLSTPSELLFDTRRISYFSGAVFLVASIEAGIPFFHEIGNCDIPVFEIISSYLKIDGTIEIEDYKIIEEMAIQYIDRKRNKFDVFFKENREHVEGKFQIVGYDPMNMIKLDNKIYCNHFILLKDTNTNNQVFLNGPVVVELEPETINKVIAYFK